MTELAPAAALALETAKQGAVRAASAGRPGGEAGATAGAGAGGAARVQDVDIPALQRALRSGRRYPQFPAVLHETQMIPDLASTHC